MPELRARYVAVINYGYEQGATASCRRGSSCIDSLPVRHGGLLFRWIPAWGAVGRLRISSRVVVRDRLCPQLWCREVFWPQNLWLMASLSWVDGSLCVDHYFRRSAALFPWRHGLLAVSWLRGDLSPWLTATHGFATGTPILREIDWTSWLARPRRPQ